jgi:Hint domain
MATSKTIASGTSIASFPFPSASYTLVNLGTVGSATATKAVSSTHATDTVSNSGSILANGTTLTGFGVYMSSGGSVTNLSGGLITAFTGVFMSGATGVVVNDSEILGNTTNSIATGVYLMKGGSVTNQASSTIAGFTGVHVSGAAGTVINTGSILAGTSGTGVGINLGAGGSVTNQSGGLVSGYSGIEVSGTVAGTVVNFGNVVASTAGGLGGVYLGKGGQVTNQSGASISGINGIVLAGTTAGTVVNSGSIYGYANGVSVALGGTVTNQSSGAISGYTGIYFKDTVASGSVVNFGSIGGNATGGDGVDLGKGGSVTNQANATISGYDAVVAAYAAGTVVNAGTIISYTGADGYGVRLFFGGSVTNQTNASISAVYQGVHIIGTSTSTAGVVNSGTISASGSNSHGVWLLAQGGDSLTNQASGSISGYIGVELEGSAGSVGTLVNAGRITGNTASPGTAVSAGSAVYLSIGGSVTNQSGGTLSGKIGVLIGGTAGGVGGTVVNAGSIIGAAGGTAVALAAGFTDRVVFDPGGSFVGIVSGGNTIGGASISTLELASSAATGALSGLGSNYIDFASVTIDSSAHWQMTGSNSLAAGGSITNSGTLTLSSASLTDAGGLVNNGVILLDPSTLTAAALTGSGSLTIGTSGTLDAQGTVASTETIAFGGTYGVLQVGNASLVSGKIANFGTYETIDLPNLAFRSGSSSATVNSGGTLIATNGISSNTLFLTGTVTHPLLVTQDSGTGTDISVLCFCAGTGIATPQGEVRVDRLAVGDEVLTAGGRARRIAWIGKGRVLATRGRRGPATPLIVRRGALADNVPNRDLRLTKGHALHLDGVLIPVEFLVNHRSVLWDDMAQEVSIYHVELETHDVLLANGAPAESYRDDGNRWLFANANTGWDLPPKEPCAPIVTGGPAVDAVWLRLLERAGPRPGLPLTEDPDLHLLVDGSRVDAVSRLGEVYLFQLPAGREVVRIVSRSAAPDELGVSRDPRVLGVALRRIVFRQGTRFSVVKAPDDRLAEGFHGFESTGALRWTNGDALLPAALHNQYRGVVDLLLHVCATTRYLAGSATRQAA